MRHYFSVHQIPGKEFFINFNFNSKKFKFLSSKGVFSKKKVDRGTIVLLKNLILSENSEILDMGCGYGVIGIVIAKTHPSCKVTMVEINKRAVQLAKKNIKLNHVKNAKVIFGNLYEPIKGKKFDFIVCNPPISAGLDTCYKIIDGAKEFLNDGGKLEIVAREKKGGRRLKYRMFQIFGNCEIIAREKGYYVYLSKNFKSD
ncbi:MAG: class I SAM-dependent methyltransferase [Candidatus Parvarchaeota archaeon]|nr:class I SAM-dependent methyltransferase [Candidatus Jingweiarchaeum tengchongense]MCW1297776.1 class I SAM-dependent methyltransferase [Candidatus Jingweiarchaeum tengchongense]MCW1299786.1 class I SAM-dependent methyltransferase [Candidatus Jingweiarchaeum tengchongense]MCW1304243.1 class I SAM-dependent methyltransferase [Candidatus Jingweiarchaeum tengchongense]MCW1305271.1 class I SAM-dependent methyltransferase [Candidatus Jingweiarchaeum tengchongense]